MVLAASLLLAVAQPLTSGLFDEQGSFDVFFSLLIVAVLLLVFEEREHRRIALSLGLAAFLGVWVGHGVGGPAGRLLVVAAHLLAAGFFAFALYWILRAIFAKEVSSDAIFGERGSPELLARHLRRARGADRTPAAAAKAVGREIALMADLPGPKMRIGQLAEEPIQIASGGTFTLTTRDIVGDAGRASMTFARLPQVVKPGDKLFLNDGIIQLEVERVDGPDVHCRVLTGGELRSRKGLNLPGIDLGISAFTERDRECLKFALAHGVDAVSQSFVESAADIQAVREAARSFGGDPFVLAKIERSRALEHVDEILAAADGIMVARGDLGVEVPIEHIAILQKTLVRKAVRLGKPVIIATQMLESMTHSRQPTRAEATDVANAVLDGTDCVMLSGESATGDFPVEAVATLCPHHGGNRTTPARADLWERLKTLPREMEYSTADLLSLSVEAVIAASSPAAVVVPTRSGATARAIARFRLPVWIAAPTELRQRGPAPAVHLRGRTGAYATGSAMMGGVRPRLGACRGIARPCGPACPGPFPRTPARKPPHGDPATH